MSVAAPVTATGLLLRVFIAGVCAPFVVSGVIKVCDLVATSHEMASLGIPHPFSVAVLVAAVQLGGSSLAILHRGSWAAFGALLLASFTVCSTWSSHAFWTIQGAGFIAEMNIFFEHVSIVFALLMVAWGHVKSVESAKSSEFREHASTLGSSNVEY